MLHKIYLKYQKTFDRLKLEIKKLGKRASLINEKNKMKVNKLWQKQLERP